MISGSCIWSHFYVQYQFVNKSLNDYKKIFKLKISLEFKLQCIKKHTSKNLKSCQERFKCLNIVSNCFFLINTLLKFTDVSQQLFHLQAACIEYNASCFVVNVDLQFRSQYITNKLFRFYKVTMFYKSS